VSQVVVLLKVLHLIIALGVILGVLLQSGKSAGLSGAIDGGATHIFGKKKGLDEKLGRLTTIFAILFMITSVALALLN
jgi:preprotein translocase subunit SecG